MNKPEKKVKPDPFAHWPERIFTGIGRQRRRHLYLNFGYPDLRCEQAPKPRTAAACPVCKHAYADLLTNPAPMCRECREDKLVEWGLSVQDECGVNLGWRKPDVVKRAELVSRAELPGTTRNQVSKPAA